MFPCFLMDKTMLKSGINGDAKETSDFILGEKLFALPISQDFPCFLFHDWAVNLLFNIFPTKGCSVGCSVGC